MMDGTRTETAKLRDAVPAVLSPEALRERLRWARRRGHEAYLWPEVPIRDWRRSLLEIERMTQIIVAGGDLEGVQRAGAEVASRAASLTGVRAREPVRLEAPAGERALGIAAFTSGMGPLLGYWVRSGVISTDAATAAVLDAHFEHGRRRGQRMHETTEAVVSRLVEAGVDPVLIKSAHTADYFPDRGTRPAADIDLVVEPAQLQRAEAALDRGGYALVRRTRRPAKSDWLPPGVSSELRSIDLSHEDNPFTIELHTGLDRDFFGVRTVRFPIGSDDLAPARPPFAGARILRQPLRAAYLAIHASEELHQLQLVRIVELVEVLRCDAGSGALDWSSLEERLRARDALRFACPAFELAERLAPGVLPASFQARVREAATPRMRRVLDRIGPGTAQRLEGVSLEERLLWAHGPAETVRRLWRLLTPFAGDAGTMMRILARRTISLATGRVSMRR